jgi:hypothetical protein
VLGANEGVATEVVMAAAADRLAGAVDLVDDDAAAGGVVVEGDIAEPR